MRIGLNGRDRDSGLFRDRFEVRGTASTAVFLPDRLNGTIGEDPRRIDGTALTTPPSYFWPLIGRGAGSVGLLAASHRSVQCRFSEGMIGCIDHLEGERTDIQGAVTVRIH